MKIISYFKEKLKDILFYRQFGSVGVGSTIPLNDRKKIVGKKHIYLGDYCSIGPG